MPAAPARDEWVEAVPFLGLPSGGARLSEKAAVFVVDLEGLLTQARSMWKVEQDCLDESEKKGLIRQ